MSVSWHRTEHECEIFLFPLGPPILKKSRVRPWRWQLFLLLVVKLLQVRPACVHYVPRPNFLPQALLHKIMNN